MTLNLVFSAIKPLPVFIFLFFSLAFYFFGGEWEGRNRSKGKRGLNSPLVAFTYIDS